MLNITTMLITAQKTFIFLARFIGITQSTK